MKYDFLDKTINSLKNKDLRMKITPYIINNELELINDDLSFTEFSLSNYYNNSDVRLILQKLENQFQIKENGNVLLR
jgi:hypothetical protein